MIRLIRLAYNVAADALRFTLAPFGAGVGFLMGDEAALLADLIPAWTDPADEARRTGRSS